MNRTSLHIIWIGLFISLISIFGFLAAVVSVNIYIIATVALAVGIWLFIYVNKKATPDLTNDINRNAFMILVVGLLLLSGISCVLVREHGDIDSIGNWNFAAKYLANPPHWKQLLAYNPVYSHPDYPMGYFGATAFFWRLFHTQNEVVPFALTLFATLSIPALIFLELYKKYLGMAIVILVLFIFNPYYINCGLNQYADTLLSFYILSAFITMNHFRESNNKIYLLLCTASLGAAMWTKNEGIFITIIFCTLYIRTFITKDTIKHSILGLLPCLLALAIFRLCYNPANDLGTIGGDQTFIAKILDKGRYKLIAEHILDSLDGNFIGLKILGLLYIAYNIFIRKNLSRNFYIICLVLAAYLAIFLITPRDIDWHLKTSLERLILQLYPSFLLIIGFELSKIKMPQIDISGNK